MTPKNSEPAEDTFGIDALDKLLEEGVLKGYARMDTALTVAALFLVVMWGVFTYFPAPSLPFLLSDYPAVVHNGALHQVSTISEGWNRDTLRPFTAFTMAVDWRLSGGSAGWFHLVNVSLHLLNSALVFLLCRRCFDREQLSDVICLAPALVFLAHPATAVSALSVADRGVLLGTCFTLTATLFYLGSRTAPALILFALAWASDSGTWILPMLLCGLDLVVFRRIRWAAIAPLAFVSAAFLVVHGRTRGYYAESIPGIGGILSRAREFPDFVSGLLLPAEMLPAYADASGSIVGIILWIVAVGSGALLLGIAPAWGLSVVWVGGAYAAGGLLASPESFSTPVKGYFALSGAFLFLPAALSRVPAGVPRIAAGSTIAAILVWTSAHTHVGALKWRDEESVLRRVMELRPVDSDVARRVSELYLHQGRASRAAAQQNSGSSEAARHMEAAQTAYRKALPLLERATGGTNAADTAWLSLAEVRSALGDHQGATSALSQALRINPWSAEGCVRLAESMLESSGGSRTHEEILRAVSLYESARRIAGLSETETAQFARLLTRLGDFDAAGAVLDERLSQSASQVLRDLRDRNARSIAALKSRESRIDAVTGRERTYEEATLLHLRRQFLRSSYLLQIDLAENGFSESAWILLGQNKREMGQIAEFAGEYRDSGAISEESWERLRSAFVESGDIASAELIRGV